MMSMSLTSHSFKVVTGNKPSLFHFEFGYQSKSYRVVLSDKQIHWNSIHTYKE